MLTILKYNCLKNNHSQNMKHNLRKEDDVPESTGVYEAILYLLTSFEVGTNNSGMADNN